MSPVPGPRMTREKQGEPRSRCHAASACAHAPVPEVDVAGHLLAARVAVADVHDGAQAPAAHVGLAVRQRLPETGRVTAAVMHCACIAYHRDCDELVQLAVPASSGHLTAFERLLMRRRPLAQCHRVSRSGCRVGQVSGAASGKQPRRAQVCRRGALLCRVEHGSRAAACVCRQGGLRATPCAGPGAAAGPETRARRWPPWRRPCAARPRARPRPRPCARRTRRA